MKPGSGERILVRSHLPTRHYIRTTTRCPAFYHIAISANPYGTTALSFFIVITMKGIETKPTTGDDDDDDVGAVLI